jgi:cytochrome c-type biogenesis protein
LIADVMAAFLAGLLSCASACVLPLLPAFIGWLGGVSSGMEVRPRLAVMARAGLFVAGFGTAFTALGAGAALIGSAAAGYRVLLIRASGLVLIALGISLLIGLPLVMREWRLVIAHRLPRTPVAAYVVGVAFAVGWTPCVGPLLAAVLVLAAGTATVVRGAALLATYSAGLGLPFLACAALVGPVTALLGRLRGAYPALNATAAVVLIAIGALTLSNRETALNSLVPDLGGAVQSLQPATPVAAPPATSSSLLGRPVPAATLTDLNGHRLSLGGLRGRPLLVNFWATWCVPCRQELPVFAASARSHQAQGLAVVPVNYQEGPQAVKGFWAELGINLTPYLDPDGATAREFGVGLQSTGLPMTVLVDRGGIVRSVLPGEVGADLLEANLVRTLLP